ncbi:MAG: ABC transporter ATP-binding protein [candidate division Zixibacteria bacterium]|nr:ABC transporter ATP-binding protein [candidate division Zixibacteria bacterium]
MIKVENLRKSFVDIAAVDEISFSIEVGEVFGLLGPNGAGKTTTINMIVGVLKPDSGTVNINGETDPTKADIRLQIGNSPQAIALYEELTAQENLEFLGRLYRLSGKKLKKRVEWALEFAGLTKRRKSKVATFSGGMKRRLNMAGALVHDPPVLLFDEPTVGVDPQSRNMIFNSIEGLKKQGRTIVYTTHYMEEAQRLCDRVAILDYGKILALGDVDDLIAQYGGKAIIEAEVENNADIPNDFSGTFDGNRLKIETSDPMKDLARLGQAGLNFKHLRVDRPNLEKVFLNLTGRSLRD